MKLTSRRKALNPAFKRFQYLPHMRPGKPSGLGSGLPAVLLNPAQDEAQRPAAVSNLSIRATDNTQPFSSQACE
jgi:hypothetical protein